MSEIEYLSKRSESKGYTLYILRFSDGGLYIGQTNDLNKRLREHSSKATKAAKFSKDHEDFKLVYRENYISRLEVMKREKQLKGWTRVKKEALISGNLKLLKEL